MYLGASPVVSCSYSDCWETTLKPCGLIDSLVSLATRMDFRVRNGKYDIPSLKSSFLVFGFRRSEAGRSPQSKSE